MSGAPEEEPQDGPVHYQVSITGRQAGFFFIALLAALGLAFFFGMKTGAASHRAPDAATRLASVSDLPVPTAVPEEPRTPPPAAAPAEKPLGFEDALAPAAGKGAAEKGAKRGAEKLAEAPAVPAVPAVPAERAVPAKPTAPPLARVEPAPEKAPARPVEKAPEPTPRPAARPEPQRDGEAWVHAAALNAEKADAVAADLREKGFKVDVSPVKGKTDLFRVRVGPYADRAKAEAAAKKLRADKKWRLNPEVRLARP